ncbi:MAG: CoA transferase [Chloroflexota bacterium]|nr:CoA transferase [Chloroflexota bacterium]
MPALDDIIVIDASQGKAAALCSMLLADNGARVIKIGQSRDHMDSDPEFAILDRGKEFCAVSLEEKDKIVKLISRADVLIDDLDVGDERRKHLDFEDLVVLNPGLVHCSMTPFGTDGPIRMEPHIPDLVKARMGIFHSAPGFREGHIYVVHPIVEVGAGILAAQGVVAALFSRLVTLSGRKLETSLMAGALLFTPLAGGTSVPQQTRNSTAVGGAPFYSVYECSDGKWLQLGCIHLGFIDQASSVMGIADVLLDPKYGGGRIPTDDSAREELFEIVKNIMKSDSSGNWATRLEEADVPFAIVATVSEAMANTQVIHNGLIHELIDPVFGEMTQYGLTLQLSGTPGHIKGPRKEVGWDELELSPQQQDYVFSPTLLATELPLEGVKVGDITNVIAGPVAGRLLADLGADVLKIETFTGDFSRGPSAIFRSLNSNKRSISIDSKNPDGRDTLQHIVSECDALVANLRPGATERMGIGGQQLREINPTIVETHVTAFGWDGPLSSRPGVDPLAQAYMGLQHAQGGEGNQPSYLSHLAPCDYSGGALAAYGTVLGLYVKKKTGIGQKIDTNLLNMGTLMVNGDFASFKGKEPRRLSDPGQHGMSDFRRLYKTSDGWIFVNAEGNNSSLQLLEVMNVRNSSCIDSKKHSCIGIDLENEFVERDSEYWLKFLASNGISAAPSVEHFSSNIFEDNQVIANGMMCTKKLGEEELLLIQRYINFVGSRDPVVYPTPNLGEHTVEILIESNIRMDRINYLKDVGAIKVHNEQKR